MKTSVNKIYTTGLLASLMILSTSIGFAQERTHTGLYLSMQAGPAFGYINANDNIGDSFKVTGTAIGFDFQIGGAIKENVILYGTGGIKSINGPTIDGQFQGIPIDKFKFSSDYSIHEFMFGAGSTYYLQQNFFFSGSVGMGYFSFEDASTKTRTDTSYGFSYQLKAGKEWWISPRWALGAALEYGGTRTNDSSMNYEETWQSHRYSVRFTATMTGRKSM
jgi:hypothetical protein